jgi:hypothetical protein
MNGKLLKLAKRRERLAAEAEAQRLALAQNVEVWRKPLAIADQGLVALRCVKRHPLLVTGSSVALLSIWRPGNIGKWFRRGWVAWQFLSKFNSKSKN